MAVPARETDRRLSRFLDALRRLGRRVTHQRLEIAREAASTDEHPDIETVHKPVRERIPTVSVDTVYRTMRLLVDLGLASVVLTDHERMRYDANANAHHRFVCTKCGMARDCHTGYFDRFRVPKEVRSRKQVRSARLRLRGVCRRFGARPRQSER